MSGFRKASEIQAEEVDWLYPDVKEGEDGLFPRSMISFIAGKPEQFKGVMACHVATYVSKNGGKVLYSAQEDAEGLMTRPRLEAAGADLDRITLKKLILPDDLKEISDYIIDNGIDLLIIDPLPAHLHGVTVGSPHLRSKVLNPLNEILVAAECGCIIVDHVNKKVQPTQHPLSAVGGSGSGMAAASRMGFFFGVNPENEDECILAPVKSNIRERPQCVFYEKDDTAVKIETDAGKHIEKQMPVLLFDREGTFDPIKLVQSKGITNGAVGRPDDKRSQAAEWLVKYLTKAGKPVKAKVIYEDAKQAGMAEKTLRRAANDYIERFGKGPGQSWDLSADVKETIADAEQSLKEGDTTHTKKGEDVTAAKITVTKKKAEAKVKKDNANKVQPQIEPPPVVSKDELLSDEEINNLLAELGDPAGKDGDK